MALRMLGAILLVAEAGLVRSTLPVPVLPYLFFVPAIMAASFLFGAVAGSVSILISTGAAGFFFLPPTMSFALQSPAELLSMILFAVITAGIAFVTTALRRSLLQHGMDVDALMTTRDELKAFNLTLEDRVAEQLASRLTIEEALRQSQKMEAVGQLTGGLAHDMNNLLAGIIGSLDVMRRRIGRGELSRLDRYMDNAQSAADRAASLTHRLLAFSRRQTLEPTVCDPNKLVVGMLDMLRRTLGTEICIDVTTSCAAWTILVDRSQLENAILNLCLNARDAMPSGGRITIAIEDKTFDPDEAKLRELEPGDHVAISVTDSGCGMDEEMCFRIFEPFFTTKTAGQGTGLGLSMIYGFVKQSRGHVRVFSDPGSGTTLKMILPRSLAAAECAKSPTGELCEAAGETVLVVDDEPSVRLVLEDALEGLGYRVLSAHDGAEGLRMIEANDAIDLVVSDVGMPVMNGRQMADAARVVRPDLKILFLTGYAAQSVLADGTLEIGMHVMTKPFAVDDLGARIAAILA